MKKALYFVFGLIVGILIITVLPNISNGEAEAEGNISEIVGSWVSTTQYSTINGTVSVRHMIQFNDDGTGVYHNPYYTPVSTHFTYFYEIHSGSVIINAEYSTKKDGEKIKLSNELCSISICENGMIFSNPFDSGTQAQRPYAFTRA